MIVVDQPFAIGDELVGRLQHLIRNCRAFGFRQGVGATPGMEPHAETFSRFELPVDQPFPGVAGKAILMVERRGAAMLDEFRHRGEGGMVETRLGEPRKDGIDPVQPFDDREFRPVEVGAVTHEALEEMMVGVDQPGIDEPARRIADFGAFRQRTIGQFRADGADDGPISQDIGVAQDARAAAVIGNHRGAALEEIARHVTLRARRVLGPAATRAAGECPAFR